MKEALVEALVERERPVEFCRQIPQRVESVIHNSRNMSTMLSTICG